MLNILYYIYLIFVALPLLLTATLVTSVLTGFGSIIFGGRWWGYYPAHIWAKIFCILTFVRVEVKGRENYDKNKEVRIGITNGVCLCEHCHEEFHKVYGYGNNTKEQYIEFKENKNKGEM